MREIITSKENIIITFGDSEKGIFYYWCLQISLYGSILLIAIIPLFIKNLILLFLSLTIPLYLLTSFNSRLLWLSFYHHYEFNKNEVIHQYRRRRKIYQERFDIKPLPLEITVERYDPDDFKEKGLSAGKEVWMDINVEQGETHWFCDEFTKKEADKLLNAFIDLYQLELIEKKNGEDKEEIYLYKIGIHNH